MNKLYYGNCPKIMANAMKSNSVDLITSVYETVSICDDIANACFSVKTTRLYESKAALMKTMDEKIRTVIERTAIYENAILLDINALARFEF